MLNKIKRLLLGNLLTLDEVIDEGSGINSFRFHYKEDLNWKAGQHGIFRIGKLKFTKSIRPFSISSAPSEGFIQITTNINSALLSEFKSSLKAMKIGDTIRMHGPAGSMVVNKKKKLVMIAGGLGITPFRAILKDIQNTSTENLDVNLLHIDKSNKFLFHPINQENIESHKFITQDSFYSQLQNKASEFGNNADYLISGSPQFVKSVTDTLNKASINSSLIKKDPFYGTK